MSSDNRATSTRRRATSLVEMMVVLAVSAAIFGIAGTLLFSLLTGRGDGRKNLERQIDQMRLTEQFRRDVHAADAAEVPAEEPQLQLMLPGERSVDYRFANQQLQRCEKQRDQVVRYETYRLENATEVRFEIDKAAEAAFARVVWTEVVAPSGMSSAGTSAAAARELVALVGRDRPLSIAIAASSEPDAEEPTTDPGDEP